MQIYVTYFKLRNTNIWLNKKNESHKLRSLNNNTFWVLKNSKKIILFLRFVKSFVCTTVEHHM